ncbi:uncharacterized protein LOC133255683 isoform X1 [Bos javanicus]|uniref:uncharacterized protein LOC133255683 isoform X1 n=1 Tax=Bos javanicus TaxID=9906 RepID=UPI002AA7783C|nr:uncharacterized protein LOC133255683 isoform X1 [Bos javanicus]
MICSGGVLNCPEEANARETEEDDKEERSPPNPPPSSEPEYAALQGPADTLSWTAPQGASLPQAGSEEGRRRAAGSGSCQLLTAAPRPRRAKPSDFRSGVSPSLGPAAHTGAEKRLPMVWRPSHRSSSRPWTRLRGMWDPSSLTRDRTHTPCTGRLSQCWTAREDSAVSYKAKGTITIGASSPIPRCLPKRNKISVHTKTCM